MTVKVLIVDDNEMYRSAFKRNLMIRDYDVVEAENGEEALEVFRTERPEVVVTDLNMRTPTEGLDLIRSLKQIEPLVPVVMISAVGTFEEGAEASRLGAHRVISKARIDDEIESLYATIDEANASGARNRQVRDEVESITAKQTRGDDAETDWPEDLAPEDIARLREIVADQTLHDTVRGEAYDSLISATERDRLEDLQGAVEDADRKDLELAERQLAEEIHNLAELDEASYKELRTAEYFFIRQGGDQPRADADFSRTIGFSYCFAVENEAKSRLRKRLQRFLGNKASFNLIRGLIDERTGQLDLFYHQHLARLQQTIQFDFTVDNVRQVFQRILEHGSRYKPDGLKALGIMVLCFGRKYQIRKRNGVITIDNPLGLKGLDRDEEVIRFAYLLVALQHFRNPYIHPEISEMEKVSNIRKTAIECLKETGKLV